MIIKKEELFNTKIKLNSPEESRKVQSRFKEFNIQFSDIEKFIMYKYLYIDNKGRITYGELDSTFNSHGNKEITLKDLFMQEKPQTFIAKGTPNLVKALIEDLKLLGFIPILNGNETYKSVANYSDFDFINSKENYSKLFVEKTNGDYQRENDIEFNLPQDYQKCVDYATSAINYWTEVEKVPKKPTSTTITIGSKNIEVIINKDGSMKYSGSHGGDFSIRYVKEILGYFKEFKFASNEKEYSNIIDLRDIKWVMGRSLFLNSYIQFIHFGCWADGCEFSIKELQQIIEEYNKLQ